MFNEFGYDLIYKYLIYSSCFQCTFYCMCLEFAFLLGTSHVIIDLGLYFLCSQYSPKHVVVSGHDN